MLVNNLYFIEETDKGTGADEVLGSEIIDPKEMLIKTKKGQEFSSKVCHCHTFELHISLPGLRFGATGHLFLLARGDGHGVAG